MVEKILDKYLNHVELSEQYNHSSSRSLESRNDIYNTASNIETSLEHIQKDIDEISDKFRQVGSIKGNGEELTKIKYFNPETKMDQLFDVRIII